MSFQVVKNATVDEEAAINFLQNKNCLRKTAPSCVICNRAMTLVKLGGRAERMWRCPSHKGKKLSIRDGSFWARSHVPLRKMVELAYFWALEVPVTKVVEETDLSQKTAVQWYSFFRDVCSHWLLQNHQVALNQPLLWLFKAQLVTVKYLQVFSSISNQSSFS
jgi:hypothetical protein